MSTALVLFSGGKDSTVVLTWAKAHYDNVIALAYEVPYRPTGEARAAEHIARCLKIPLKRIPLDFLSDLASEPDVIHPGSRQTVGAYVPHRNLVFHSLACHLASRWSCTAVVAGHILSDAQAYADASNAFLVSLYALANDAADIEHVDALRSGVPSTPLVLELPLMGLTDSEVIALGRELKAPLADSWSCLEDGAAPCESCVSCIDRRRAFASQ